jgi:hypothetical protein
MEFLLKMFQRRYENKREKCTADRLLNSLERPIT